jgi:hypothetical protein
MTATVPDDASGWGFVQADMALAAAGGLASVTGSSSSSSGAVSTTTASAGSHGGGGAFDPYSLAALAAFAGMIIVRRRAA